VIASEQKRIAKMQEELKMDMAMRNLILNRN